MRFDQQNDVRRHEVERVVSKMVFDSLDGRALTMSAVVVTDRRKSRLHRVDEVSKWVRNSAGIRPFCMTSFTRSDAAALALAGGVLGQPQSRRSIARRKRT